jgi:hypothetical protein
MELCPKPVPMGRAERVALPELRRIGIPGNHLEDQALDHRQQLRQRLLLVANRVFRGQNTHTFNQ